MVRLKHRYLLVNILYPEAGSKAYKANAAAKDDLPWAVKFRQPSSEQLSAKLLVRLIRDVVAEIFGDYGSGMISASLVVKYFSQATSTAIIRVSRAHYKLVWAALTYITRLPHPMDQACVIQVVRTSGTIRKAEEEAIRRARLSILKAQHPSSHNTGTAYDRAGRTEPSEDVDDTDMLAGIEDPDEPGDEDEDE